MTRFDLIRDEFSGVCGAVKLYIDGTTIFFIDVDTDRVEGCRSVTASCGCCSETIDWESELSYELEYMDDIDYQDLVEELRKLK